MLRVSVAFPLIENNPSRIEMNCQNEIIQYRIFSEFKPTISENKYTKWCFFFLRFNIYKLRQILLFKNKKEKNKDFMS